MLSVVLVYNIQCCGCSHASIHCSLESSYITGVQTDASDISIIYNDIKQVFTFVKLQQAKIWYLKNIFEVGVCPIILYNFNVKK